MQHVQGTSPDAGVQTWTLLAISVSESWVGGGELPVKDVNHDGVGGASVPLIGTASPSVNKTLTMTEAKRKRMIENEALLG